MADTAPVRMQIWNVQEATILTAYANPRELSEKIAVAYADHTVPGMSYKPVQYTATENLKISLELFWVANSPDDLRKLDEARRFLHSLCYPWRGKVAPPRALFVWPSQFSLNCIVRDVEGGHKSFNKNLNTNVWTCKVSLEEIRDERLYGDDVLRSGTQRSASSSVLTE